MMEEKCHYTRVKCEMESFGLSLKKKRFSRKVQLQQSH